MTRKERTTTPSLTPFYSALAQKFFVPESVIKKCVFQTLAQFSERQNSGTIFSEEDLVALLLTTTVASRGPKNDHHKTDRCQYTLETYSDKALVVRPQSTGRGGPVSRIPEVDFLKLMAIGGKFNKFLQGGPGFIFMKFMRKSTEQFLENGFENDDLTEQLVSKLVGVPLVVTVGDDDESVFRLLLKKGKRDDVYVGEWQRVTQNDSGKWVVSDINAKPREKKVVVRRDDVRGDDVRGNNVRGIAVATTNDGERIHLVGRFYEDKPAAVLWEDKIKDMTDQELKEMLTDRDLGRKKRDRDSRVSEILQSFTINTKNYTISRYTEKSIVLRNRDNSKPITKDQIKQFKDAVGGMYNARLKQGGPGLIFSSKLKRCRRLALFLQTTESPKDIGKLYSLCEGKHPPE